MDNEGDVPSDIVVYRGTKQLMGGEDACPICLGVGSYQCVHCHEEDDLGFHIAEECEACGGKEAPFPNSHICLTCSGNGKKTPPEQLFAEPEGMRNVDVDGYRLQVWDTGREDSWGKQKLYYRFTDPEGYVLFENDDFHCAPNTPIDSDEMLRSLLSFLTLCPGDTDEDYFYKYTHRQWEFAQDGAEELSPWAREDTEEIFKDWEE